MHSNNIISSFILILLVNLTYQQESGAYEVRELSLNRPYASVFSTSQSQWQLTGNTLVTDRFIRLTSDAQSKAGGLWNTIPITYPDWEIHVQFKVHGDNKNFFGDGFVIWYVRDPRLSGPVFGNQDFFHGLAIVMDTYANKVGYHPHTYPYISAVLNNGSLHYDHDSDGTDINLGGCESPFRGRDTDTHVAVRYQNDTLTVSTDIEGKNSWTECFSLNNIQLPTHYYFGFSAATGELSDNHDIISVHTYQLDSSEERKQADRKYILPAAPSATVGETVVMSSQTTGRSVLKIFFIVIGVIVLCLGGVGIYYYMNNRKRGPRFY